MRKKKLRMVFHIGGQMATRTRKRKTAVVGSPKFEKNKKKNKEDQEKEKPKQEDIKVQKDGLQLPELDEKVKIVILDSELKARQLKWGHEPMPLAELFETSAECAYSVVTGKEANLGKSRGINPLWYMFYEAYNRHGNITLSPEVLWMTILDGFGQEVNANPEKHRGVLVPHKERKDIVIKVDQDDDYTAFFGLINPYINGLCKSAVLEQLHTKFSTDTIASQTIQTGYILNGLQKYFAYTMRTKCGIRGVHFTGTQSDWDILSCKVKSIVDLLPGCPAWATYIAGVNEIIDKFKATREGKEETDLKWWRQVMEEGHTGRGSGAKTHYTGWILKLFYATHNSVRIVDFPATPFFNFPLNVIRSDGSIHPKIVKGGLVGVNYDKEKHLFSVVSGLGVFNDVSSLKKAIS